MKKSIFIIALLMMQLFLFNQLTAATITVTKPAAGEKVEAGKRYLFVEWTASPMDATAHLDYSIDNGSTWVRFATGTANDGARYWDVPNVAAANCFIRITRSDGTASDVSSKFTIAPKITVTKPAAGEQVEAGKRYLYVNWTTSLMEGTAHLDYSINNGSTWVRFATGTANDGARYWDVPNVAAANCFIRITRSDGLSSDISSKFSITPQQSTIAVTSPNGGEQWVIGSTKTVKWTSSSFTGTVHLDYSINNGNSWTRFATSVPNDGSHNWNVPYYPNRRSLIRITKSDGSVQDISDNKFSLISKYNWKSKFITEYNGSWHAKLENLSDLFDPTGVDNWGSKSIYKLGYGIDALTSMYLATGSKTYLNDALSLIATVISQATDNPNDNFQDGYLGWVGGTQLPDAEKKYENKEVVLWESCGWRYVTKILQVMKQRNLHTNNTYMTQFNQILSFTEANIWDKWYNRGTNQQYIYRSNTHMTSHWGYIAADLYGLTSDSARKTQCQQVFTTINSKIYNQLHIVSPNAYCWDDTWNTYGVNIQDTTHGNHTISYIIESYQRGFFWTNAKIIKFKNTLKEKIWQENVCNFADFVNGSYGSVGGYNNTGRRQADGWLKLARYFGDVFKLYEDSLSCGFSPNIDRPGHFYAIMALNEKYFKQIY